MDLGLNWRCVRPAKLIKVFDATSTRNMREAGVEAKSTTAADKFGTAWSSKWKPPKNTAFLGSV
eukprot:5824172-Amphidinium_carterae.2